MKVVGFNLSKVSAERIKTLEKPKINSNIQFLDIEKSSIDIVSSGVLKIGFRHDLSYESEENPKDKQAHILFEGSMLISVPESEVDEIMEKWENKNLDSSFNLPLYNVILQKCASKSLQLQEELNIPTHMQIPRLGVQRASQSPN